MSKQTGNQYVRLFSRNMKLQLLKRIFNYFRFLCTPPEQREVEELMKKFVEYMNADNSATAGALLTADPVFILPWAGVIENRTGKYFQKLPCLSPCNTGNFCGFILSHITRTWMSYRKAHLSLLLHNGGTVI